MDYTGAVLQEHGLALTRENWLAMNNITESDLDAEQESLLPEYAQIGGQNAR